jgi:hypothetical protein
MPDDFLAMRNLFMLLTGCSRQLAPSADPLLRQMTPGDGRPDALAS